MIVQPDLSFERELFRTHRTVTAMDEVGRGAIAGPVMVGAVVVTADRRRQPSGLRDSKLLTPLGRTRLVEPVQAWVASWSIGHASPAEIDAVGIMAALRIAALRALEGLPHPADVVLLDGNVDYLAASAAKILPPDVGGIATMSVPDGYLGYRGPVVTRVKGDRDCASIAAASVLAKVTRDAMMDDLHGQFPQYEWVHNKGYGTPAHTAAIRHHGLCQHHRRSWNLAGRGFVASSVGDGG